MKIIVMSTHRLPGKRALIRSAIRRREPPSQSWVVQSFAGMVMRKRKGGIPARRRTIFQGKKLPDSLDVTGAPIYFEGQAGQDPRVPTTVPDPCPPHVGSKFPVRNRFLDRKKGPASAGACPTREGCPSGGFIWGMRNCRSGAANFMLWRREVQAADMNCFLWEPIS